MPKAKPKPTGYHDLTPERLSELIAEIQKENPEYSDVEADADAYVLLEGFLPFQTAAKAETSRTFLPAVNAALAAVNSAMKGSESKEHLKAFYELLTLHREAVNAYADAIAYHFPDLAREAQAIKSYALLSAPGESISSPDAKAIASEIADFVRQLPDRLYPLIDAAEMGIIADRKKRPKITGATHKADEYPLYSSMGMDAILTAVSDGKHGRNYKTDDYGTTRIHHKKGNGYAVILRQQETEQLDEITANLDFDGVIVLLYVTKVVTRVAGISTPPGTVPYGVIDLADVAKKALGEPRSKAEAAENRLKVWHAIQFAARALISGERNWQYSGGKIDTRISSPLLMLGAREDPFDWTPRQIQEPPLRIQIALTPDWQRHVKTHQIWEFLPNAEIIGAIPANQTVGAWTRCVGFAWMNWCRLNVKEALNPTGERPTRRRLLEHFSPKKSLPREILDSKNPISAPTHFEGVEDYLTEVGFLAPLAKERDVKTVKGILSGSEESRQGWGEKWLDEELKDWQAGSRITDALNEIGAKIPEPKIVDFKALDAAAKKKSARKKAKSATK